MAMPVNKRKVAFLEISPEKFQLEDGDGSLSTGCPTPTGNRTAAILQAPTDSSSQSGPQSGSPSGGCSRDFPIKEMMEEKADEVVFYEGHWISQIEYFKLKALERQAKSMCRCGDRYQKFCQCDLTVGPRKCDCCGEGTTKVCWCPPNENGTFGETDEAMLNFWKTRIPVRQKG